MKNFLKKFAIFLGIITIVSATSSMVTSISVAADDNGRGVGSCDTFLGLVPWDCKVGEINSDTALKENIATIATNILTDLTVIAAYLVLGYVIYGGYLYMFASGDAGKVANGKKTLTQAFIGLAIVMSAYVIFGAIRIALIGDKSLGDCGPTSECVDGGQMVTNLIQWIVGMGGVVAVIFIVVGAWGYMTAAGDPGKLAKAKNTILYALIGLVIVALAEILTAFIAGVIRDANGSDTAYIQNVNPPLIANLNKEIPNEKI